LVRSRSYFFDLDAIREPHRSTSRRSARPVPLVPPTWAGPLAGRNDGLLRARAAGQPGHPLGKNPGDVWELAAHAYRGAHFATFPEALIRRPLLATCPEWVCARCGVPYRREPSCSCRAGLVPGLVLDPFFGTGTVGVAARQLGRDWLGIELNRTYVALAWERLRRAARGTPEARAA
jgi:hypothetical protein